MSEISTTISILAITISVASTLLSAHSIITTKAVRYVYTKDVYYKDAPRWVRFGLYIHRGRPYKAERNDRKAQA